MEQQPQLALRVQDVTASLAFYTDRLGFARLSAEPGSDLATVADFDGDPLLLAGPAAEDVPSLLSPPRAVLPPGATLTFHCADLAALRARWAQHAITAREAQNVWGDPALEAQDPDGYTLRFTVPRQRSPEELLALYGQGVEALDEALAGLTDAELDLAKAPGEWTIRQIVHHIADGDDLWAMAIKAALTSDGCEYRHSWYSPDNVCAETLDYAGRSVAPALALLRANRAHLLQLVRHLPGAWERSILFAWPWEPTSRRLTVGNMLESQAGHALAHCAEIRTIRQHHAR
jgi:catechol 2,3-dioxygenase-like lactoylglutathione lyase family enzyme